MYGEYVYPACRRLLEWKQRRYPNNPHRQPWEGPSGNQKGDKNDLPCKNIEETFQICSEPEEQENCTGFGRVLSWLEKINFSFPLWTLPEKPFIPPMQEGVRPPPLKHTHRFTPETFRSPTWSSAMERDTQGGCTNTCRDVREARSVSRAVSTPALRSNGPKSPLLLL